MALPIFGTIVRSRRHAARHCSLQARVLRSVLLAVFLWPLIGWPSGQAAHAETASAQRTALAQKTKHNDGTLMLLGGRPGTSYAGMAHDIASALDGRDGLRVLAVDAAGGTETLRDLLLLRGVDLALVAANALAYADTSGTFGPGLRGRLTCVTRLYGEEVHILVGPDIASLSNLRGRKIAVPPDDGNAELTVRDLLRRLRIEAEVVRVAAADAVDDVRSGTFAALVLMGGKPLRFVAGLPKDGSLRLLAVPSGQELGDDYAPADFRSDDYPALIPDGRTIDTVSVSAVLVANNMAKSDESSRRLDRFVPAFFGALSDLASPQRHPKWSDVNLAAALGGWSRIASAQEWLDKIKQEQTASMQKKFEEFLSSASPAGSPPIPPKVRRRLFEEFVSWTRNATGAPTQAARP